MPSHPKPLLGELLLRRGVISSDQLTEALQTQAGTTKHLGEILVEMGAISPEQLTETLKLQEQLARGGGDTRGSRLAGHQGSDAEALSSGARPGDAGAVDLCRAAPPRGRPMCRTDAAYTVLGEDGAAGGEAVPPRIKHSDEGKSPAIAPVWFLLRYRSDPLLRPAGRTQPP